LRIIGKIVEVDLLHGLSPSVTASGLLVFLMRKKIPPSWGGFSDFGF
jgi:hypothetical protein